MKEAYLIKVEDFRIGGGVDYKQIQINFDYQWKRKNDRFTYYVPNIYIPLFQKYIIELQTKNVKKKCFLWNSNLKARKWIQKSGENLAKNLYNALCWDRS